MLNQLTEAINNYGVHKFFRMLLEERQNITANSPAIPVVTIPGLDHEIHIYGASAYRNCEDEWCAMYVMCIDGEEYYSEGTWDEDFTVYDSGLDPWLDNDPNDTD